MLKLIAVNYTVMLNGYSQWLNIKGKNNFIETSLGLISVMLALSILKIYCLCCLYIWRLNVVLTNKNETKCGLQNKNYAKMSLHFRWPKRDETKCYNFISSRFVAFPMSHSWSHFRGWHQGCQVFATKPAQLLLKTSPIAFRGGFPGKVRIPGAKYHVIGVASTRGHEKQPAATVLK